MKIDLHVHSGFSVCASTNYKEAADAFAEQNMHFVLCNHYTACYTRPYGGEYSVDEYPVRFVEEYQRAAEYGKQKGVRVFFGIEVGIVLPDCPYAEFLIYGATPKMLLDCPRLYDLGQRELYDWCKANDLMLVQAHPYRKEQGHFPHDMTLVDGVEINCHFRFLREEERVRKLAAENNLLITCGSDYHRLGQQGAGGIICEDVQTEQELKNVLMSNNFEVFIR